ncbi:probable pectin methylesterase CGR2 [Juglans regia]|uniref:Probable pectin methylesterase CGR2 n=1 Tax=Juglans regia TaxID=51240 RepID=A0A2I4H1M6_JUGRE|nr:probable pectin methylesterase CGR2 [Juglans regia]
MASSKSNLLLLLCALFAIFLIVSSEVLAVSNDHTECRTIPILKKAYGDSMHKILHVGPDICSVVSKLLKEEETEAWGVEPYDIEDADTNCKALVRKGVVRVADINFPLPYRPKSFFLVIVSDALDYLSPRYLNKTLPDLARVSADGLVIFTENHKETTGLEEAAKHGDPGYGYPGGEYGSHGGYSSHGRYPRRGCRYRCDCHRYRYAPGCQRCCNAN